MKTSDLYLEGARCKFSDLPNAWCGCWSRRPDVSDDTPGRTNDNQGEA